MSKVITKFSRVSIIVGYCYIVYVRRLVIATVLKTTTLKKNRLFQKQKYYNSKIKLKCTNNIISTIISTSCMYSIQLPTYSYLLIFTFIGSQSVIEVS